MNLQKWLRYLERTLHIHEETSKPKAKAMPHVDQHLSTELFVTPEGTLCAHTPHGEVRKVTGFSTIYGAEKTNTYIHEFGQLGVVKPHGPLLTKRR